VRKNNSWHLNSIIYIAKKVVSLAEVRIGVRYFAARTVTFVFVERLLGLFAVNFLARVDDLIVPLSLFY